MKKTQVIESTFKFLKQFRSRLDEELALAGIDFPPVFMKILKMVEKIPNCSANKITQILEKDKAQIARAIKNMAAHELLAQIRNEKDSRVKILCLTDKGKQTLKVFRVVEQTMEKSMIAGVPTDELEVFMKVLNQTRSNLYVGTYKYTFKLKDFNLKFD